MAALRERLSWAEGAVHDGPRRYLLMRPDALMGALVRLPGDAARAAWLEAVAASVQAHGGQSVAAYAAQLGGDEKALCDATVAAAADLGWGSWTLARDTAPGGGPRLRLTVHGSPFAAGWRAAGGGDPAQPLCAPIAAILRALAAQVLGGDVQVHEARCAAQAAVHSCEFEAFRAPPQEAS
jgi:predicted hydrocarbon binding protein